MAGKLPHPRVSWGPLVSCPGPRQVPALEDSGDVTDCLSFSIFQDFPYEFKIHCLVSWSALVKNKNTLTGLTFWWRETDNETKGTIGERYAADP